MKGKGSVIVNGTYCPKFKLVEILSLILVHLFVFIIPGPNTLLVLKNSLGGGFRSGWITSWGIACTIALHASLALIITQFLVQTFYEYFVVIKLLGVGYIGNLGICSIKNAYRMSSVKKDILNLVPVEMIGLNNGQIQTDSSFQTGFLLDLFNPYITLFYISICPPFLKNPQLIFTFVSTAFILNVIWLSGLVYLTSFTQRHLKINLQKLEFCAGVLFIIFAIFLLMKH